MKKNLSIITINYNNFYGLKRTVESVISQTWKEFEFIIIDGGSTDDSAGYIRKIEEHLNYWISEPDKGIYNAMNKGINFAGGEYILFLNSGDCLADQLVLSDVFSRKNTEDFLYGDCMVTANETGELLRWKNPEMLKWSNAFNVVLNHQSMFIKKQLFHRDKYDETNYQIVSDWAYWFKHIIINGSSYYYIDRAISIYDTNGLSSQESARRCINDEKLFFYKQHADIIIPKLLELNKEQLTALNNYYKLNNNINSSLLLKSAFYLQSRIQGLLFLFRKYLRRILFR